MFWIINHTFDLVRGHVQPHFISNALIEVGDTNSHEWNVALTRNGVPVDLTGATVNGYFVRTDGNTVVVEGSVSGNVATVVTSATCFAVQGDVKAIMKITLDGSTITADAILLPARKDITDSYVDPGSVVPSLQQLLALIDECEDAAAAAESAANHSVVYDSAQALTSAQQAQARTNIGAMDASAVSSAISANIDTGLNTAGKSADSKATGDKIAELKSVTDALESLGEYVYSKNLWDGTSTANKYIDGNGDIGDNENYNLSDYIPVTAGKYITATRSMTSTTRGVMNYSSTAFFDENKTFISRLTTDVKQAPSNAAYMRVNLQRAYDPTTYKVMVEYCNSDGTGIAGGYVPYYPAFYLDKTNPLYGKKICAFGDSIASGDGGDRNAMTWVKYVAERFGMSAYNRGVGSSCITNEDKDGVARTGYCYVDASGDAGEQRAVYSAQQTFADYPNEISPWMEDTERTNTIPTDTDIVVIIAGANDVATARNMETAYRAMLDHIITRVPNAKIFPCVLPFHQSYDLGTSEIKAVYNNTRTMIKSVAADYGFEYIDLRAEMGVNADNYSTYMSDTVHFNKDAGKMRTAETIIAHLQHVCFIK